jgi:hypothetical protein
MAILDFDTFHNTQITFIWPTPPYQFYCSHHVLAAQGCYDKHDIIKWLHMHLACEWQSGTAYVKSALIFISVPCITSWVWHEE